MYLPGLQGGASGGVQTHEQPLHQAKANEFLFITFRAYTSICTENTYFCLVVHLLSALELIYYMRQNAHLFHPIHFHFPPKTKTIQFIHQCILLCDHNHYDTQL